MIKLKSLINESKILVPRRSPEERERRWVQETYRKIQDYIKRGSVGDLDLSGTPIKILPDNLKIIGGYLGLSSSKIEDLNNLEHVESLDLSRSSNIKKLPDKLKRVEENLWLHHSKIEDLNNLECVRMRLDLRYTPIKKLPDNLKKVGEDLKLRHSHIEDLNNLEYVGGNLDLFDTPLSKIMTGEEIQSKIQIDGGIFL